MSPTLRPRSILVNALTVSRVPFIAVFMVLAVLARRAGDDWVLAVAAGAAMFVAAITDLFDGLLARRWQVVSDFGKMADPLMDKVFYVVVFPTLLWLIGDQGDNRVHAFVMLVFTVLYVLRDQWVTFLRSVAAFFHADVGALWFGKVRTALSFPAAGGIYAYVALHRYLPADWNARALAAVYAVEAALIVLNLWSVLVYTRAYLPYLRRAIHPSEHHD